jgi:Tol biopolymer transport system component
LLPGKVRIYHRAWFTVVLLILIGAGLIVLLYGRRLFFASAEPIDPHAPVRLTDNPNDDTGPQWMRDGRIRFSRVYSDHRSETWIMNADGSDQTLVKNPEGKRIVSWSPDEQKVIFFKLDDPSKYYLSNQDGTGEVLLPAHGGEWSADSKMLVYMQRIAGDDLDIFTYNVETGKVQNLTNNPALDADPSFSADGKQIAFDSDRDGNQEIYLMNVDGSGLRRLTFNTAVDTHPAFSPDGTQIIFTSNRDSEDADVYSMNADGSNQIKLVGWDRSNETAGPGAWSPDGTRIAFFSDRNGGHDDIYTVSAETIRPNLILSDAEHDLIAPSYSPDGQKIVYTMELANKSGELRIYDPRSNESSLVKKTELPNTLPRWSPDGQRIAFYDRVEGNSEIFSVKPDGSDLRRLTTDPSIDAEPAWSPDGDKIVFETGRGAPLGKPQLYVMNSDGTDQHPLTPRKGWEGNASWAPDGTSVVFTCDREDSPGNLLDICEIDADGMNERHVLFHRDEDTYPVISPDGKRIVFVASSDGNSELYVMNRDGSGLIRLTRDPAEDDFPQWSPDGSKIIFCSNRGGKFAIYEITL